MKNLKLTRITKGYCQMKLSKETGVAQCYISHIEQGYHNPKPETRRKFEKVLGCKIDWSNCEK